MYGIVEMALDTIHCSQSLYSILPTLPLLTAHSLSLYVHTHTHIQPIPKAVVPLPKDIKVICCDDEQTALSWTAGIRLAKYGLQLRDNFHKAKMTQFKLEDLAAPEGVQRNADVS